MKKKLTHPLGIFIIFIHALYFLIACKIGSIYLVDSYGYLNQAKNILLHQSWYAEDWNAPVLIDYFTIRPPLYAFFIVAVQSIFHSDIFVIAAQNLLSVFNIFLLWKLLDKFEITQKNINISITLALLFFPSQFIHANFIMTEMLFQTLMMGVFYFSVKTIQSPNFKSVFIICFLLSLAMLTKPVIFLFGIVLFVFFVVIFWKKNKKMLISFLLLPFTYHLLCLQNQHTTDFYHYSSIKVMADIRVNARYILAQKYGADSASNFATQVFKEADAKPDYESRYQYIAERCKEVYLQNKTTFVLLYLKGIASTLLDPGRFDLAVFFGLQDNTTVGFLHRYHTEGIKAIPDILNNQPILLLAFLFFILLWNILGCIAFCVFIFDKKNDLVLRILVLLFVGYIVSATGISGLCRYRVPVFPELVFAITFALPQLFDFAKRKISHA